MKNYYDTLQLSRDADTDQIRRAFRNMSMRYHPDRNKGSRFYEEKFKEINEAYQVLKDPVRRWQYKQGLERRSSAPRPCGDWSTPDFASGDYGSRRRKPNYRPKADYRTTASRAGSGGGTFWSCILFLVFSIPFFMAGPGDPETVSTAEFTSFERPSVYDDAPAYDLKKELNERYRRDFSNLNEILKVDPDLRGLDLETGYYELKGRSIKLSWDVLQLLREKHWKRQ